jgi:hypothetical protein
MPSVYGCRVSAIREKGFCVEVLEDHGTSQLGQYMGIKFYRLWFPALTQWSKWMIYNHEEHAVVFEMSKKHNIMRLFLSTK